MILTSSRYSCGYRLACARRVSAGALGEGLSYCFEGHDSDIQDAMHVADNAGLDVCSSARPAQNARR